MSKSVFFLKPVDDGLPADAKNIAVPEGKTTIGRGQFLGCSEKRVSRNHAFLEVTADGQLYITPTHVNPCFYHEKGVLDPLVVLAKGDPQVLEPGDQFSLLPESLRYEVGMEAGATRRKSLENGDAAKECGMTERSEARKMAANLKHKLTTTEDETLSKKDSPAAPETDGTPESPEEEPAKSSRTLPSWMVEEDDGGSSAEKPVPKKKAINPRPQGPKKGKQVDYTDFFPISSDDDEDDEKASVASPKPKKLEKKKTRVAAKHDMSDDDAPEEPRSEAGDGKSVTPSKRRGSLTDDVPETKKRKSCEFGKKCYRKNPVHFKECSHPGDEDYTSDVEEKNKEKSDSSEGEDGPECEFGTDCYRKNPKHWKEFKHTKRPTRKAAREAKRKAAARTGDSEDESFESSFIDDDSDGSCYSPDDEDLRTLKKEAQEFTSNRKMYEMKS